MLKTFIFSESGAVTVDYVVILGGVVAMALSVVGDIAQGTLNLTDRIFERTTFESIIAEVEQSYSATGSGDIGGNANGNGNPGNDKDVGKAGENPSGKGGWGNGSKGRSE